MDINIKTDDSKFGYVVRGIIEQDNKYLLMQVTESDGSKSSFHFSGGHVEIGETTIQALQREIKEEIGFDIEDVKSFCVLENLWTRNCKLNHGLEFFFLVKPLTHLNTKDYTSMENDKGKIKILEFKWLTAEQLKSFDAKPLVVKEMIINKQLNQFCHLINQESKYDRF